LTAFFLFDKVLEAKVTIEYKRISLCKTEEIKEFAGMISLMGEEG